MLEWLTPGVGSAIGAIGQMAGGMMANAANAKQAAAQMAFQERMAGQQRQWAGELSQAQYEYQKNLNREARNWDAWMQGTAYQRATADMKAAGINPMLAYVQGGAGTGNVGAGSSSMSGVGSAPSGAQARMENVLGDLSHSARETARIGPQVKLLQTQAEQGKEQTALLGEQKRLVDAQVDQARANTALQVVQAFTERFRPGLIQAQTAAANAQPSYLEAQSTAAYAAGEQSSSAAQLNRQGYRMNETQGRPGFAGAFTNAAERAGSAAGTAARAAGGVVSGAVDTLRSLFNRERPAYPSSARPDPR